MISAQRKERSETEKGPDKITFKQKPEVEGRQQVNAKKNIPGREKSNCEHRLDLFKELQENEGDRGIR